MNESASKRPPDLAVEPSAMQEAIGSAWPGTRVLDAKPIVGGFWATLYRLHLTGQPSNVPGDLVLRIMPPDAEHAKELAVQGAVAEQGYSTPRVHLAAPAGTPIGGAWVLMDYVRGSTVGKLAGWDAIRSLPGIMWRLPGLLASHMAALHRLDPRPVTQAVLATSPSAVWTVAAVLDELRRDAQALGRDDLVDAIGVLAERRPKAKVEVVCHGDLHALNLLAFDGRTMVLDWATAVCAEPAYDVAFTRFLLATPPMPLNGSLGRLAKAVAGWFARRFVERYSAANPTASLEELDWYSALHGARVLIVFGKLVRELGPDGGGHPMRFVTGAAAAALARGIGKEVQP